MLLSCMGNPSGPAGHLPCKAEVFSQSKNNHLRILVTNEAIDTKILMELTQ